MEDLEKQLSELKLAKPPQWLKARAMVAAQNGYAGVARRKRYMTIFAAAAAAVMLVVVTGGHFIGAFGFLVHGGSSQDTTGASSLMSSPATSAPLPTMEVYQRLSKDAASRPHETGIEPHDASATPAVESTASVEAPSADAPEDASQG